MGSRRRVKLFLVEGPSDETALVRPFAALARGDDGSAARTESEAFYCDVTTVRLFREDAGFRVEQKVRDTIRGFILQRIESRHVYAWNDLMQIVHVVDLDGAFIPDERVLQGSSPGTVYGEDFIRTADVAAMLKRNHEKASCLNELIACSALTCRRKAVPYSIHFVSRNLEHALYGLARDCTDEEKRALSVAFSEKCRRSPEFFAQLLYSRDVKVPGNDLRSTWTYAEKGVHSLERGSNLHLLVENADS